MGVQRKTWPTDGYCMHATCTIIIITIGDDDDYKVHRKFRGDCRLQCSFFWMRNKVSQIKLNETPSLRKICLARREKVQLLR